MTKINIMKGMGHVEFKLISDVGWRGRVGVGMVRSSRMERKGGSWKGKK